MNFSLCCHAHRTSTILFISMSGHELICCGGTRFSRNRMVFLSFHHHCSDLRCIRCVWLSQHGWFQVQWLDTWQSISITAKELVPVVIAAATRGRFWQHKCICFRCDNMAVISMLKSRTSRDHLLHSSPSMLSHLVCSNLSL